jgi:PKD repeat protein
MKRLFFVALVLVVLLVVGPAYAYDETTATIAHWDTNSLLTVTPGYNNSASVLSIGDEILFKDDILTVKPDTARPVCVYTWTYQPTIHAHNWENRTVYDCDAGSYTVVTGTTTLGFAGCTPDQSLCSSDYQIPWLVWNTSAPSVIVPTASFICTPTSQFPDADVVCTDTSTNTPTDWYWTVDAESLGILGWQSSTSRNFTWQSHYPGLYSVNLRANNSAGSDWENKTSYVSISVNATPNNCNLPIVSGYHRTSFQCTDSNSDAAISGCDLQLRDLEGGAWSNTTDSSDGRWCIDTLPLHHINGYGQSTGYSDGSRLNVQEWNGMIYTILMVPGYVPSPLAGNVWVYVHVTESGADLSGTYISLSSTGLYTKSDTTDSSGIARFQWQNSTEVYINAAKAGYTTSSRVITTSAPGPDFVSIELHKGTQTLPLTPTLGPGGTVPTTIGPWGTPGPEGTMPLGYTNAQGQRMMDLLAVHGYDLVLLCIMVTILALLGIKLGK